MAYRISKDTFFIPLEDGQFLCYVPLAKRHIVVSRPIKEMLEDLDDPAMESNPLAVKILEYYEQQGIINPKEVNYPVSVPSKIEPLTLGIMPSLDCQLRCSYCYAEPGRSQKDLDFEMAKAAIDLVVKQLLKRELKQLILTFLGGGEPTFNWKLLQKITNYAEDQCKRHGLEPQFVISTNGVLSESQAEWISRHFLYAHVTLDGPKEDHDRTRTFADGQGTFDHIFKVIKQFDRLKFPYIVRAVIVPETICKMTEFVEMFKGMKPKALWLGYLSCPPKNVNQSLDFEAYYKGLRKAQKVAERLELNLSNYEFLAQFSWDHCYIHNFIVMPNGITSCVRATDPHKEVDKHFIYGRFDPEKKEFKFDLEKLNYLKSLFEPWEEKECKSCFAKFSCHSRCPYRVLHPEVKDKTNKGYCLFTKKILLDYLMK